MCNLSWTPHSNLEKNNSLNHSCVSSKMGCLEYPRTKKMNCQWIPFIFQGSNPATSSSKPIQVLRNACFHRNLKFPHPIVTTLHFGPCMFVMLIRTLPPPPPPWIALEWPLSGFCVRGSKKALGLCSRESVKTKVSDFVVSEKDNECQNIKILQEILCWTQA